MQSTSTRERYSPSSIVAGMLSPGLSNHSSNHTFTPPVVETAIQIQFSDLPRWNSVHHGLYFPKIRARYPHFELIPEIPPVVETFPPSPERLQLQLTAV